VVNALAPDNVGVVLDEGFQSWDGVDEATARTIVSELTDVTIVALSLSTERNRILRTVETVTPNVVHLVRAPEEMPPELLASIRDELDPIRLICSRIERSIRNSGTDSQARRTISFSTLHIVRAEKLAPPAWSTIALSVAGSSSRAPFQSSSPAALDRPTFARPSQASR
jgi:phosphoribosylanthranilate isomerase